MRKLLLIFLVFTTIESLSQTHSKQVTMDWICEKIKKYGTGHPTSSGYFRYTNISYNEGIILIKGENEGLYKDEFTIDLNKMSSFYNVGSVNFYIEGIKIAKSNRKSLTSEVSGFTNSLRNSMSLYLDWDQEENLKGRMEQALNDLLIILRKERKGNNEPY